MRLKRPEGRLMRILSIIAEAAAALFASVPARVPRNCDEYGEELAWMGAGEMDGFELHDEGNGR